VVASVFPPHEEGNTLVFNDTAIRVLNNSKMKHSHPLPERETQLAFNETRLEEITSIKSFHDFTNDLAPSS